MLPRACWSRCASPGVDFAGHISGSRFVMLMQSEDWSALAERALALFPAAVAAQLAPEVAQRGYFVVRRRDGHEQVRPLPKLAIGVVPVLPGVFETRHEVMAAAKHAAQQALARTGSAIHVDQEHGNAYPQSILF
jgi:hypothetical protein